MAQRSFLRDTDAAVSAGAVLVGILIVGFIGLLVMLTAFLRREAPGGVPKPALETGSASPMAGPAVGVSGARMCRRCNIAVKPFMRGLTAECPNCGTQLGTGSA